MTSSTRASGSATSCPAASCITIVSRLFPSIASFVASRRARPRPRWRPGPHSRRCVTDNRRSRLRLRPGVQWLRVGGRFSSGSGPGSGRPLGPSSCARASASCVLRVSRSTSRAVIRASSAATWRSDRRQVGVRPSQRHSRSTMRLREIVPDQMFPFHETTGQRYPRLTAAWNRLRYQPPFEAGFVDAARLGAQGGRSGQGCALRCRTVQHRQGQRCAPLAADLRSCCVRCRCRSCRTPTLTGRHRAP